MTTVIHIKANKEVKENAQKAAKDLGLTLTDVINAALRNFIRTRENQKQCIGCLIFKKTINEYPPL